MKADKTPLDRALWKLIDEHMTELVIALLILVSVLIRALLAPNTELSPDYTFYCLDWVNKYREMGIAGGLSITMGDYYTPLNLMYASCALFDCEPWLPLAIYSCTFEYIGTFFLFRILKLLLEEKGAAGAGKRAALAAVLTLFLPHTIINSALWKQCDSIYFCFILISIWEMLREKYAAGFVFLAVSFAVKLQAVFFIPFYVAMYIAKRKYSIFNFFWIPAVYLIAGIPAVLCRHGLRATYLTYLYQTQEGVTEGYGMTAYYPNVYVFGLEGTYYRVIADTSKEEHEKLNKLDILDDDYDKQLAEAVSPLKITQREDLTDRILTQEEMDALVGKTGKELIEEGWESTGYNLEDMEFYLGHDCFYYTVTFDYDGPKMENTDDFDEYAAIEPLKVKKVEYMGLGDACNLE